MMFSVLFTPIGRYSVIIMVGIALCMYGIHRIKEEAIAKVEAAAVSDVLRRTENAVDAGNAVDVSSDGVRKPDANRRDE